MLTIDLPPSLSPRVLNALKADPKTVDLRSLEVHFFQGAARILELLEEEVVGEVVAGAFLRRAKEVGDCAGRVGATPTQGGGEGFLRGLEEWERGCELAFFFSFTLVLCCFSEGRACVIGVWWGGEDGC